MKRWMLICALLVWLASGLTAHAQTCTVVPATSNLSSTYSYDPFAVANNNTQGGFSFSCTRQPGNNGTQFPATFWVGLSNGSQLTSTTPPATLNYGMFQNTGCSTPWSLSNGFTVNNSAIGNGDQTTTTFNVSFCFSIYSSQVTAKPSTSYINGTPIIYVRSNNSAGQLLGQASFAVGTNIVDACNLSTPPGPMAINYTSFASSDALGASNFAVRCTNITPYTLALNTYGGTLLGLNYTLSLSASSAMGSGVAQPYTVNGSIAAGQAGTCSGASCPATATHTLTISY